MFYDSPFSLFLLLINVMVSGYAIFFDSNLIDHLSFRPRKVLQDKEYYRMITGGFVHGGIGHLLFNMITLFYFGPALEARLGSAGFLILFFGAELAAHGFTLWLHRKSPNYAAVGASGAISGIVISFSIFYPFKLIYLFLIPVGIPAWIFALAFIFFSAYAMTRKGNHQMGGIAHEAHLGGALGGIVLTMLLDWSAISVFISQITR
ncbi:MAG: rhomboid family intramembrane serine protease [Bacteroidetes bacterium]|nr:rhomboid family intramembrane serine protease [Bacteroidota bacterium]